VENFGSPLPVLVTEALTFVDRNTTVSVNISEDGWAWLVYGRKLLVWQCKANIHSKQRRTFKSQCRELLLPQSDLAHKADCIAVWVLPGHQVMKDQTNFIYNVFIINIDSRLFQYIILIMSIFYFFKKVLIFSNPVYIQT